MKEIDLMKIFDSMKENEISELIIKDGSKLYEVRRGGFKQNITTNSQPIMQATGQAGSISHVISQQSMPQQNIASATTSAEVKEKKVEGKKLHEVKSPLVGTYYASPKPDSPPFVDMGVKIKKGQTLCIVEAMKNFNEIESDVDGVIREVCIKTGELVEFGKVLFRVELT